MAKRVIAFILVLVLAFSLASCGKKGNKTSEKIVEPEKKVAILVAPEAQYPEDYQAAAALAAAYPKSVVVKEYKDSRILRAGDAEIMTIAKEVAEDKTFGAIIFARATQFTYYAIQKAKKANPDIVTICVEPEESLSLVAGAADLVICADWAKAAGDIVAAASSAKAEYLVMFSINRHLENELTLGLQSSLKKGCEDKGIKYVYDSAYDPISSGGIDTAKKVVDEAIPRLVNNKLIAGKNVALFSTDSSVQTKLVEQANKNGFIYSCPSFPTAYNGVGEAYDVKYNKDISAYVDAVKAAVTADTEGTGRFSVYSFPLATVMLKGALYTAFDILVAKTTVTDAANLSQRVIMRLTDAAGNDNFTAAAYSKEYTNVFKAYCANSMVTL